MASINVPSRTRARVTERTHEGTPAHHLNPITRLLRTVMTYMLWEDQHYEDGQSIADRIKEYVAQCRATDVAAIAIRAREDMKLRHTPLYLARLLSQGTKEQRLVVSDLLFRIIQRADELKEFVAIYWKDKKQPLSAQVKKGLARAFTKFNEYALAKYNGAGSAVTLRDVLFLTHAKPKDEAQAALWKRLVDNQLEVPDTWEVALSGGADKKTAFTHLIKEGKLGALALLRNLRNMTQAGVDSGLIRAAILTMQVERVLPYRFISAAKYAPQFEPELEQAMFKCLQGQPKLAGRTALLIDVSGSMTTTVSGKSEISRIDAANGVAILLREICETVNVYTFGNEATRIPARRGFALRDAIMKVFGGNTYGGKAVLMANADGYDRIIVLTDGQWHYTRTEEAVRTRLFSSDYTNMGDAKVVSPAPLTQKAYMVNVASYQNGVGYGKWTSIDGWSEAIIDYIQQFETLPE